MKVKSCLNCNLCDRCPHVRELALSIVRRVKHLGRGAILLEGVANQCVRYGPATEVADKNNSLQLNLFDDVDSAPCCSDAGQDATSKEVTNG